MKFYLPDGTPTERPHPENVEFPDGDDGYTSEPTHIRIYEEDAGDEWPWHLDGCDTIGHYTEAVERYESEAQALANLPRFVAEFVTPTCETCGNTGSVTIEDGHGHSADAECWDCDRGKREVTIRLAPIHAEEGTTYTPFTDGWGVGYEVTAEGKPTRWVCLYPSQTDSLEEANVFAYLDAHRPTVDQPPVEPECYITIWPEPNDD